MSPHAYTEDQLVEQPAIGLFGQLGWQTVSAMEETFGPGGTLGRETKGEVVLVERLRAALVKLNDGLPPEAIQTAIDELARDRSTMSAVAANREVYQLLKDGILVSIPDREHGPGQKLWPASRVHHALQPRTERHGRAGHQNPQRSMRSSPPVRDPTARQSGDRGLDRLL